MKTPEEITKDIIDKWCDEQCVSFNSANRMLISDKDLLLLEESFTQAIRAERDARLPSFKRFEHAFHHATAKAFYDWLRDNMVQSGPSSEPIAVSIHLNSHGDLYSDKIYSEKDLQSARNGEHPEIQDYKQFIITGSNLKVEDYT